MKPMDAVRALFSPIEQPAGPHDNRTAVAKMDNAQRLQTRQADWGSFPSWETQLLQAFGQRVRTFAPPSVTEALGVPAVFRAWSLIANTTGSLAMETYRDGARLDVGAAPRLVQRPDPFRTGHVFYRDTADLLASRGEVWWWVAKRNADDLPESLIVVPPWEVRVDRTKDRLRPQVFWTIDGIEKEMDRRDMRQLTLMLDHSTGRGVGPLQLCGAAVSVAVESQTWAANFYAGGGNPSIGLQAAGSLGQSEDDPDGLTEAARLKAQFALRDPNTPFIYDEGIVDVREFTTNEQGAQMLEARLHNRGDVANMFSMPGALVEYAAPGSTLTYQNITDVFRLWVRSGLQINYLVPIEEEMSDLLPRSTSSHFNLDSFERSDPKSRWETYQLMASVIGIDAAAQIARESEGLEPGDIEFEPVAPAPPSAFPTRLPVARSAEPVRCNGTRMLKGLRKSCGKLLAEAGPFSGTCSRCGTVYTAA